MKRLTLLIATILMALSLTAQVEYLYDFNSLTEGSKNLNGQDGWVTHYQTAASSQDFDVSYVCGSDMAPDESIAIWYPYGGSGVGRTATRKASSNFNFNFQNGGIMDLEIDMNRTWWGSFFGVGFDADGDGHILPGMTDPDGGVYVFIKSQGDSGHAKVSLPDGSSVPFDYEQGGWTRYKMSFDFTAYDGAGAVTIFVKPGCEGEWIQMAGCTNVCMNLTPGSGDMKDYHVWDGVFFHSQGGTGGFDNLLVRQQPDGNAQLIEMADIPNQLIFNEPITLVATASSGLPVSFEMMEGPATINGNILTLTGETGLVKFKATQSGNAAEFYEATHNIKINGAQAYTQHLWRTCSPNPAGCQPQNGTWTYSRSGWCPGSIGMVWNFSLDDYLANGSANLIYEFSPDYVDQCHPNYPDCVNGQNGCTDCQNTYNPVLRVSGKLVTYSHHTDILMDTPEWPDVDKDPFNVTITPNPVKNNMTITTDYELGRMGVHILNSHGVEVRNFSMDKQATVDMSDLPAGLYFVNIVGGKVVTKKVIVE